MNSFSVKTQPDYAKVQQAAKPSNGLTGDSMAKGQSGSFANQKKEAEHFDDNLLDSICQKLLTGCALSPWEADYLRQRHPELYKKAMMAAKGREDRGIGREDHKAEDRPYQAGTGQIYQFMTKIKMAEAGVASGILWDTFYDFIAR